MSLTPTFIVYPAIDLRSGKVVRLRHGDPKEQTTYSSDPLAVVREWLHLGLKWMHIINLDGAFGEVEAANFKVLQKISQITNDHGACIQYGGGLRSLSEIKTFIDMGISRLILGTIAIENPEMTQEAIELFGPTRVAVSLDAMNGLIRVRGWQQETPIQAKVLGKKLYEQGVRWAIFTDISRDGTGRGVNIPATAELAQATGLNVIASGGVRSIVDVAAAREAGLPGIIVGRALYERQISIQDCLKFMEQDLG